jgi:hypothetical protein
MACCVNKGNAQYIHTKIKKGVVRICPATPFFNTLHGQINPAIRLVENSGQGAEKHNHVLPL